MNEETTKPSIEEKVQNAIASGGVAMKPRWHFALAAILCAVGTVLVAITLIFLSSLLVFALRRSGAIFGPQFGWRGWYAFASSLPWLIVGLGLMFILILELLVRRYAFGYRRPLLFSVLFILVVVVLGSYVLEKFSFQRRMMRFTTRMRVPFAGDVYRGFEAAHFDAINHGVVVATTTDGFILETPGGEQLRIVVGPQTRGFFGTLAPGMRAAVFGMRAGGSVPAFGIRVIDED